jgi:MIT (microtubule interacting and transport) domain-containing protein
MVGADQQVAAARPAFHRPNNSRSFTTDIRQTNDIATRLNVKEQQKERDKERKAMLSKALQKAHRAVLLDNAHNFEGAIEAYSEACELLHQVLIRSTADEERRKLDQIVS